MKTVGMPGVLKKEPGFFFFFFSVCLFGEEAEIPSDRFSIGSAQSRYSPQLVSLLLLVMGSRGCVIQDELSIQTASE